MTPSIRQLAWLIARDVNRTVGGGNASMELLRRSFEARGWVDAQTHGLFVAVSRLTPGTNILAYCAAAGWRLQRWRGAAAAVAAASVPGALIVFGLAATLVRLDRYPAIQIALSLGMLVAGLLVLSSAFHLVRPYARAGRWPFVAIIATLAGGLYLVGWTPVRILLVSAVAGSLLPSKTSPPAAPEPKGTEVTGA